MYSQIEQEYLDNLLAAKYPAEPSIDGMQLAAADTTRLPEVVVTGEAEPPGPGGPAGKPEPRFGRGGVTKAMSEAAGGMEVPIIGLADMLAGALRGTVAQSLGLPGDIESLVRLLTGGEQVLPTTERVSEMLPPVVPPSATDIGGAKVAHRRHTAEIAGKLGEFNPIVGAPEMVKMGVKGAKAAGEALAPAAGKMAEDYLRATGGIMNVAPDGKSTGGLSFPSVDTDNRLRLKAKREESVLAGKALPGAPKNSRIEIKAPKGSSLPNFVVGNITPQDWVARTESMLSKEEIAKYAKWYDDIKGTFLKYTNNDEAKANKYMGAWLVANQNIGVDGALSNMLLQAEQFARKVPKAEMKAGGLPLATQAARNVLSDEPILEGVGAKIADFVDSAEGKSVRSFYGNNQAGGAPFVVDIHTARDTGLVDEILLNHLERKGYQVDRQNIKADFTAGPTETQYENRADFGRGLTKYLNDIAWQGRTDWTPKEVQAVGWMSMTKLTADASEDSVTALERNLRRISMEVAPAEGSPWEAKFGERFAKLPVQRQSEITQVVTDKAMQVAKEISGIDFREMVHGTGGWQTFQNPAAVAQTLATREGAEIAANVLGYLLQQTEVWVNSIKATTKNPKSLAIDFIETGSDNLSTNEGIRSFWEKIMAADPTGLFVGYQPIKTVDGEIGIRVIVDKGGEKRMSDVQSAIQGSLSQVLKELDFNVQAYGYEADLVKARNDWKEFSDGRAYLERLANLGVKRTAADLDPVRGELEKIIESELSAGSGGKSTNTKTRSATTKAKEIIKRGQSAPVKGAE